MSQPPDDELQRGPTLDAEGRLEGRLAKVEPPPAKPAPPPDDAPIELMPRAPKAIEERVERYREDLRARNQRSTAMKVVYGAFFLGAVAFGFFMLFKPNLRPYLPDGVRNSTVLDTLTRPPDAPPVIISSDPPGATITISGTVVGQTPWAGENRWVGEPKVVIQLKGYRPYEGKLLGGKSQTLDVELTK